MLSLENAAAARASGSTGHFMCFRMPHDARDVNAGELRRQWIWVGLPQKLPNSPLAVTGTKKCRKRHFLVQLHGATFFGSIIIGFKGMLPPWT